jgi:hypothetical protein
LIVALDPGTNLSLELVCIDPHSRSREGDQLITNHQKLRRLPGSQARLQGMTREVESPAKAGIYGVRSQIRPKVILDALAVQAVSRMKRE